MLNSLDDLHVNEPPVIVCIAGLSCSGKSFIAALLKKLFFERYLVFPTVICQDSWYKDLKDIPRDIQGFYNMESVDAFHSEEFVQAVFGIYEFGKLLLPSYNISENKRTGQEVLDVGQGLVIVEGLHVIRLLSGLLVPASKQLIYVDTAPHICLQRRIERDVELFKVDASKVQNHYMNVIEPNYREYADEQRKLVIASEKGIILT